MESRNNIFDFRKSFKRISDILDSNDANYVASDTIPPRSKLTYSNGFYVSCTALFVDIRGSGSLPEKHKRPTLAKIYRSYISECVAVLNGNELCREVNIVGDCVNGIYATKTKNDVMSVVEDAAKVCSVVNYINSKLLRKGYSQIEIGVGIDDGRALMIQAGQYGSAVNDVVWMGAVVNNAAKLGNNGNKTKSDKRVMISDIVYGSVNDDYAKLFSRNVSRGCYHGDIINTGMEKELG